MLAVLVCVPTVHAGPPLPAAEWTDEARLTLAHLVQVETTSAIDRRAIPWVMARRWRMQRQGWSFAEQARRYSPALARGARTPRQHRILAQAWDTAPLRVRVLVEAWGRGAIDDPCRGRAIHWGARWLPSPLPEAECGRTANRFYSSHR